MSGERYEQSFIIFIIYLEDKETVLGGVELRKEPSCESSYLLMSHSLLHPLLFLLGRTAAGDPKVRQP